MRTQTVDAVASGPIWSTSRSTTALRTRGGPVGCVLSVSSNEGGPYDWQVIDAHHVSWATRNGNGNGRIYTITITCTDNCGNQSTSQVQVTVRTTTELSHPFLFRPGASEHRAFIFPLSRTSGCGPSDPGEH